MYPKNDLYKVYLTTSQNGRASSRLPDSTSRSTIKMMGVATNCCEKWDSFLDVGAGAGHYSVPLLTRFKKGTAVEATPFPELRELAKNPRFKLFTGLFNNITLNEQFDFILLSDVFEHIPVDQTATFVSNLAERQASGGIIYLLTPNPLFCGPAPASEIYFSKTGLGHHGHYKHYLPSEIGRIFTAKGYETIWCGYEEGRLRELVRRILYAFSSRDRRFISSRLYRFLSAPFIALLRIFFSVAGRLVEIDEIRIRQNKLATRTLAMILKKQ